MAGKHLKIFFYSLIAFSSVYFSASFLTNNSGDSGYLQASVISVLKETAKEINIEKPDLKIEKITLKKVSNPTSNFNFYKYKANVVVTNVGGTLLDGKAVIGGKGQKFVYLKNSDSSLNLKKNQKFILNDYTVIFDGKYNGGDLNFEVKSEQDTKLENNHYKVSIFELPVEIASLKVEKVSPFKKIGFVHKPLTNGFVEKDIKYFVTTDDLTFFEEKYDEIEKENGDIYGYTKIKFSKNFLEDIDWQEINDVDAYAEEQRYVYAKLSHPNGNFILSDVIKIPEFNNLDRAEFAKYFVELADINPASQGEPVFEDVSLESWYGIYVQTLFNLGLFEQAESKYLPDKKMSRAEAARVIFKYLDVKESDVIEENIPSPNEPATKEFLKYLFDEYK